MSQHDLKTFNPNVDDGLVLVDELFQWEQALLSLHAGASRPAYALAGTLWVQDAPPELLLNLYDGVADRTLARIDTGTGAVTVGDAAVIWSEVQSGHGFVAGNAVYHDGSQWLLAQADDPATTALAVVRRVSGARITLQQAGILDGLSGLTPGASYWLSPDDAGTVTSAVPASGVAQKLWVALSSSRAVVYVQPPAGTLGALIKDPTDPSDNLITPADDFAALTLRRAPGAEGYLLEVQDEDGNTLGGISAWGGLWGNMGKGVVPVGVVMAWPQTVPPSGWLVMDGQTIPDWAPQLRALYGTNLPDLRGRTILGYKAGTYGMLSGGGLARVSITNDNLPSGQFFGTWAQGSSAASPKNIESGNDYGVQVNGFWGGGASLENLPPYRVLNWIVKHDY